MKRQRILRASQIRSFGLFLAEHPGFWPELVGEDALVCGFHVGGCFLTIDEMGKLIATQPVLKAYSAVCEASHHPGDSKQSLILSGSNDHTMTGK